MKQGYVQLWHPVYCFRTPGTLRYIWIGTPQVALVYTHLELATLCRTIDHRWSLAIALAVPFLKTFKLCFINFFSQNYWGGDRRPCRPFADALDSYTKTQALVDKTWIYILLRTVCMPLSFATVWSYIFMSHWGDLLLWIYGSCRPLYSILG